MSLPLGKLPPALLAKLLASATRRDPSVLVGPALGRDAAVIELGDHVLLVAATDPITFATTQPGWYAVHVNANDVACMGARPAWFLATILLPPGSDASLVTEIFAQVDAACSALGLELIGGHTEVTDSVTRPVVAGTMLGLAPRAALAVAAPEPGDAILLTKSIAIEGTALLATQARAALDAAGVATGTIERAAALLSDPGISVVPEALALSASTPVSLMHDPTEGGVATALHELAQAAGLTLRIDRSSIPVLDETRECCAALGIDPLGLLASGALLAIVPASAVEAARDTLANVSISCRVIGHTESGPPRVIMGEPDSITPFPSFDRDEVARYFEEAASLAQAHPEGTQE